MAHDFRRDWIKERMMSFMGIDSDIYFEEMMAENDGYLDEKLDHFLADDIVSQSQDDLDKKIFHVYKTYCDRLFEEEVLVEEVGMLALFLHRLFLN